MTLSCRIERVFCTLEGRRSAHGARAWFARQAKVRPYTVSRWLAGSTFEGPPLAVLELLEARAGIEPLDPASQ